MLCHWTQKQMRRFVDCSLGLIEQALVHIHLMRCADCMALYERHETVGGMLATMPAPHSPRRLEIRILSALSIEALRRERRLARWRPMHVTLRNMLRPFAVPALGGLLVAVVLVPTFLSAIWMEPIAHADDIPLSFLATPPAFALPSPYPVGRDFTVIAYIDMRGGVYDYQVMSDEPIEGRVRAQLANALLTSRFQPAKRFGRPILGQRVIHYQRIDSLA